MALAPHEQEPVRVDMHTEEALQRPDYTAGELQHGRRHALFHLTEDYG